MTEPRPTMLAARWRRLVALVIDVLVVPVPIAIVFAAVDGLQPHGLYLLAYLTLPYFAVLNGLGRTLGKRVMNLRVADGETGGRIGWWRAFRRCLMMLGFTTLVVPLLIDVAVSLRDPYRRCWHDRAVNSVVVSA
jgi:uncharacterized RDD family membrane protein YckC